MQSIIDSDILDKIHVGIIDLWVSRVAPNLWRGNRGVPTAKTNRHDLVTSFDVMIEEELTALLNRVIPDAAVVGEEGIGRSIARAAAIIQSQELVAIVDPLDGTANFAAGLPTFAVMASICSRGETLAGLIFDPLSLEALICARGARPRWRQADGYSRAVEQWDGGPAGHGFLSVFSFPKDQRARLAVASTRFDRVETLRCSGHEFRAMAFGGADFAAYPRVRPWDHAAGSLIVTEMGGVARFIDGTEYAPWKTEGTLLCATNVTNWSAVKDALFRQYERGGVQCG